MSGEPLLSPQAWQVLLVLGLAFLLGLEREGRKATAGHYIFGGVRTFPLIGLVGYGVAVLTETHALALLLGFLGVSAFLAISYWHKVSHAGDAGVTTEVTGLLTYLLGGLVAAGWYWLATALVVVSLLLLELKAGLESLAERIPSQEILTLTKFLLLTAVILPLVPNHAFTRFAINPFRLWLVVVAVSGLSYVSYLVQWRLGERASVMSSAILGGLYSSTLATVILARRSREVAGGAGYAAAAVLASSVMYLRVLVLVALFQPQLAAALAVPLLALAVLGGGFSGVWLALASRGRKPEAARAPVNPLELSTAFLFAAVFLVLTVAARWVVEAWGELGVYALSLLAGALDVDPYVMSLAQQAGSAGVALAARAILIALSGNQLAKGVYAASLGDRPMGRAAFGALAALAGAGLLPLAWL
ncbi:MAG: MgtC/SapB family protein [Thermoanaerobaculum sp.]